MAAVSTRCTDSRSVENPTIPMNNVTVWPTRDGWSSGTSRTNVHQNDDGPGSECAEEMSANAEIVMLPRLNGSRRGRQKRGGLIIDQTNTSQNGGIRKEVPGYRSVGPDDPPSVCDKDELVAYPTGMWPVHPVSREHLRDTAQNPDNGERQDN